MRKTKKEKEAKKKIKENEKANERIYSALKKQSFEIKANNILLTCMNMISTEYIRYTKKNDSELLKNTFNSSKRIKKMLNDEQKLKRTIEIELESYYKKIRGYLVGVNKKIGYINDFKDHEEILRKTEIEFSLADDFIKKSKKLKIMYDFVLGKELTTYYIHTLYSITIMENIIKKCNFKDDIKRYIKTTITKIKKTFVEIEKEIKEKHDLKVKEFNFCKEDKIYLILSEQCKLEGISKENKTNNIWKKYSDELISYSDDQLNDEWESTLYLIGKAS